MCNDILIYTNEKFLIWVNVKVFSLHIQCIENRQQRAGAIKLAWCEIIYIIQFCAATYQISIFTDFGKSQSTISLLSMKISSLSLLTSTLEFTQMCKYSNNRESEITNHDYWIIRVFFWIIIITERWFWRIKNWTFHISLFNFISMILQILIISFFLMMCNWGMSRRLVAVNSVNMSSVVVMRAMIYHW